MTNIIALGTGSAFTMKNWQSNYIIQRNGKNLLVDCGGDIRFSLRDQGLSFKDIDACFCSHGHQDHAGGLEYLGFTRYFLYNDKGCLEMDEKLLAEKIEVEYVKFLEIWKNIPDDYWVTNLHVHI
jgi:ribonuclease BN (tRNA processing enzyme)